MTMIQFYGERRRRLYERKAHIRGAGIRVLLYGCDNFLLGETVRIRMLRGVIPQLAPFIFFSFPFTLYHFPCYSLYFLRLSRSLVIPLFSTLLVLFIRTPRGMLSSRAIYDGAMENIFCISQRQTYMNSSQRGFRAFHGSVLLSRSLPLPFFLLPEIRIRRKE